MKHWTHLALSGTAAALLAVTLVPAHADEAAARSITVTKRSAPSVSVQPGKLDLRTPALDRIFTPAQLAEMTRPRDEYREAQDVESVKVETQRNRPVYVPSGFAGIGWAVRHPSQAWRLFVPAPSE